MRRCLEREPYWQRRVRLFLLAWVTVAGAGCHDDPFVLATSHSPDGAYSAHGVDPALRDFVHEVRISKSDAPDDYGTVFRVSQLWWETALDWKSPTHLHVTITCGRHACTARDDRYWFISGERSWGAVRVTFSLEPRLRAGLNEHEVERLRRALPLDETPPTAPSSGRSRGAPTATPLSSISILG